MIDEKKTADEVKATVEPEAAPRKRGRTSNGKSGASDVPRAKGRTISAPTPTVSPGPDPESQPEVATPSDPMSTLLIPTVDGQLPEDGNQTNEAGSQLAGRLGHA